MFQKCAIFGRLEQDVFTHCSYTKYWDSSAQGYLLSEGNISKRNFSGGGVTFPYTFYCGII